MRVVVGRLGGVFGIRGELKLRPTSFGAEAIVAGTAYEIRAGDDQTRTLRCRSVRRHHDRLLVAFDGIDTPEAARPIVNAEVTAESADTPLGPGEYFDADLVGLRLLDGEGKDLGRTVVAVEHFPAQDCLVLEPGRALVPLVRAFEPRIDLAARTIAMRLPDGLLD